MGIRLSAYRYKELIDCYLFSESRDVPTQELGSSIYVVKDHGQIIQGSQRLFVFFLANVNTANEFLVQGIYALFDSFYFFKRGAPVILVGPDVDTKPIVDRLTQLGFGVASIVLTGEKLPAMTSYGHGAALQHTADQFWHHDLLLLDDTDRSQTLLDELRKEIQSQPELAVLKRKIFALTSQEEELTSRLKWYMQQSANFEEYLNLVRGSFFKDLQWYKNELEHVKNWYKKEYGHLPGFYVKLGKLFRLLK